MSLLESNIQSLNIVTNELAFTIVEEGDVFPIEAACFSPALGDFRPLCRAASLLHFDDDEMEIEIPDCVAQEVICTALEIIGF